MLTFKNISLRRGPNLLLEEATLAINPGQRVGLIGANGVGKSSLFALIRDQLHADSGELELPSGWVIGHVAQETPALHCSALDYVLDGDAELRQVERAIAEAETSGHGERLAHLHAQLEAIGGYDAHVRAARLLHGLGFSSAQESQPVSAFSGGWRMRLNLAQALMCRSDLLLLDEPTNHLDLDAVLWLEQWLIAYPGTLMLISHDRDFLDKVVGQIAHLEQRQLTLYRGNYSAFERLRSERLAQQQATYEKQQREVAHMQSFVARFRAKATKARQAQSRLKALERMELIGPAHVDSPFHFSFRPPESLPHPLMTLDKLAAGYGDRSIFSGVALTLLPGARIGLLGPNGAGKSTLIKVLADALEPLSGERIKAKNLRIGYFAQHQLEQLRGERTPLEHLLVINPKASDAELRDYLGGFGFIGDKALEPVEPFSGGEKARLVLALLVYQRPNLLLLDEPTNHLDLEMRHALSVALQEFEGAMIVVSHDRHLLRSVCDELWLVSGGKVEPFDGDLESYPQWLLAQKREQSSTVEETEKPQGDNSAEARKQRRQQEAQRRQQLQPLRNKLKKAEAEMERLGEQKQTLDVELADPALYEAEAKDRLKQKLQQQAQLNSALQAAEELWLELSEELESLQAD